MKSVTVQKKIHDRMRFEMQKSGFYNTNYQKMLHVYM